MNIVQISNTIAIPEHEIEMSAVRSQGAGGQNVNKVATAIPDGVTTPSKSR